MVAYLTKRDEVHSIKCPALLQNLMKHFGNPFYPSAIIRIKKARSKQLIFLQNIAEVVFWWG